MPAKLAMLMTEDYNQKRRFDPFNVPIRDRFVWPEHLRELNHWVKRSLTEGVPFTDAANESVPDRLRRRLLALTPSLTHLVEQLHIAATHDVTVLIEGETGTGKTHLAKLIHDCSPRHPHRFLNVSCGAIAGNLIASEFFGHVKGAFTGADAAKVGKFAAAGDGTILLDEIDTLGFEHQANLLRVIETGEFEPVGSNETQTCHARIIAATNGNLGDAVDRGTFRRDLYYRLHVVTFHLPPLRERIQDIAPLVRGMAARYGAKFGKKIIDIHPEAQRALETYNWPGNIRQLENVVQQAVLNCSGGELLADHLAPSIRVKGTAAGMTPPTNSLALNRESTEKNVILRALEKAGNSRTRAASILGVSRVTLYKKMKKYGLLAKTASLVPLVNDAPDRANSFAV
jgi:transcriptional regulator with PAS, ATPase and Fis domain